MKILEKLSLHPIEEFYQMITSREKTKIILCPIILGLVSYFVGDHVHPKVMFELVDFCTDIFNQILTILTLFISFSMAYLSILLSSSSENIDGLKDSFSKIHKIRNKECSLFQVLVVKITYTLLIEIIFLIFVLAEKFVICISPEKIIEMLLSINISVFSHIMIMMIIIVIDMYYAFWKSK